MQKCNEVEPLRLHGQVDPADMLIKVSAAISNGEPVPAAAAHWFISAVNRWIVNTISLDEAMQLKPSTGQRRGSTQRRIEARDLALVAVAARGAGRSSRLATAQAIWQALDRYCAGPWRHNRGLAACPHKPGSLDAALWQTLALNNGKPPAVERIRKVLVKTPPYS